MLFRAINTIVPCWKSYVEYWKLHHTIDFLRQTIHWHLPEWDWPMILGDVLTAPTSGDVHHPLYAELTHNNSTSHSNVEKCQSRPQSHHSYAWLSLQYHILGNGWACVQSQLKGLSRFIFVVQNTHTACTETTDYTVNIHGAPPTAS
jgi:hypothetical protein